MGTRTPLNLSEVERAELERVARRQSTPQALARRCRVILLDDRDDMTYAEIGEELSMREQTVLKWRSRFLKHRMAGLRDAAGGTDRLKATIRATDRGSERSVCLAKRTRPPRLPPWQVARARAFGHFGRGHLPYPIL